MLKIPSLPESNNLPDIAAASVDSWKERTQRMVSISTGEGKVSDALSKASNAIYRAALSGDAPIDKMIQEPLDIRACASLWLKSDEFLKAAPVSKSILQRFWKIRRKQNFQVLINLIQLYFIKYDLAGDVKLLQAFIKRELEKLPQRSLTNSKSLQKLNTHNGIVLAYEAEKRVSKLAIESNKRLDDQFRDVGIISSLQGRFTQLCRINHFIARIDALDPTSDNAEFLQELSSEPVYSALYENRLFGHKIIEQLVKRSSTFSREEVEPWLDVILSIAGDPRVPYTTPKYQKWWSRIDSTCVEIVRGLLARGDLRLFIKILEEAARTSGSEAINRMLPPRVKIMEGLLDQDKVTGARLFLGSDARRYLRGYMRGKETPSHAMLGETEKSVIMLKLDKGILIEGTHNFSLRYFEREAKEFWLEDYTRNYFDLTYFTSTLRYQYKNEFKVLGWEKAHQGFWQGALIDHLKKQGIRLDAQSMLSAEDYRKYKYTYGI